MTYPGRPPAGKVLWGATVGEQDIHERHEVPTGVRVELHRLFYRWNHWTSGWALRDIQDNQFKARFCWVSFKMPGSWLSVANGDHDATIIDMLTTLDAQGIDMWLTMHHEPEGGGGSNAPDEPSGYPAHMAANRRIRALMEVHGVTHIALCLNLMAWTWDPRSHAEPDDPNRNPDNWWDPEIYDFMSANQYVDANKTLLNENWDRILDWASENGTDLAVGEWGTKGDDELAGNHVREWYDAAVASVEPRVTGLAAFDHPSDEWVHGLWQLQGEQLTAFHEKMIESHDWHEPVPEPEPRFEDVPEDHVFFEDVEWLAAAGITKGCNPPDNTRFCPSRALTRGEMAAMMHRFAQYLEEFYDLP